MTALNLDCHIVQGYKGSATEQVGWQQPMKNERIIAQYRALPRPRPAERLQEETAEAAEFKQLSGLIKTRGTSV